MESPTAHWTCTPPARVVLETPVISSLAPNLTLCLCKLSRVGLSYDQLPQPSACMG